MLDLSMEALKLLKLKMLIDKKAVAVAERLVFFSSPQSKEHIASCLMSAELDFTATGLRLELTIESPVAC